MRELREGGGEVKGRRRGRREMGEREMGEREIGERKERGERGRGSTHSSVQLPWVINGMYMFSADWGGHLPTNLRCCILHVRGPWWISHCPSAVRSRFWVRRDQNTTRQQINVAINTCFE